jgi:DNA/RNA-binding domain of Phe-tRNA-synthetase-like protein
LLSVASGHSIGGFDADKIEGDTLTIGIGYEGEPYEAIGRGPLNVAGLPILRDAIGGIGTPTSDHERTKLTENTKHLIMVFNMYGEEMPLNDIEILTCRLLEQYANATDINMQLCNS